MPENELEIVEAIEADIDEMFGAFRTGAITRGMLEARLARLQERTRKLRMPNQNYFGGYIGAWEKAVKQPTEAAQ